MVKKNEKRKTVKDLKIRVNVQMITIAHVLWLFPLTHAPVCSVHVTAGFVKFSAFTKFGK